ncbi:MAG: OprD family outer membrane porin [Sulfurimonas sp.]|nr:OprD family outer membrane porin [Sulfurimonas sp.]
MNKFIKLSLVAAMAIGTSALAEELNESSVLQEDLSAKEESGAAKKANSFKEMFSEGTASGQIRLGYAGNMVETDGDEDQSAAAIGGQLKFETASFVGFSLGAAAYTSNYIPPLSGDQSDGEFNSELTSEAGNYTELAEAYINYSYEGLNLRAGRQLIDTPLADSDDIRMTPHTFEAYIASYTLEDIGLTVLGGSVLNWQGVDADYDNVKNHGWVETGEDGTNLAAITYAQGPIEAGAWYYDVTKAASAVYVDVVGTIEIGDDAEIVVAAQYLNEGEKDDSTIEGSIMGAMIEAGFYGVTLAAAYDSVSVDDGNQIFEGFGGGSSYTNIDTMTAGTLHDGTVGDGSSYTVGAAYELYDVNIFGVYGDYEADAIKGGEKAHVSEINLGVEYAYNDDEANVAFIYVIGEDKESSDKTDFDNDRVQLVVNYNF